MKALPAPGRDAYTVKPFAAPQTASEQSLLAVWQDLLKLDRISIDDNFFDIGGHSLLATRLQNRVRAELGSDLPLRTVFETPTVRQLAARLEGQLAPLDDAAPGPWLQRSLPTIVTTGD